MDGITAARDRRGGPGVEVGRNAAGSVGDPRDRNRPLCVEFDIRCTRLTILVVLVLLGAGCGTARNASPPTTTAAPPTSSTAPLHPVDIGGVPLVPISTSLRSLCRQAADQARAPVPCPGLVPEANPGSVYACGPPGSETCGSPQIQEADGTFLWNQYDFRVPADYVGLPSTPPGGLSTTGGPLGHFVIDAGRHLTLNRFGGPVQPVPSYCTGVPGGTAVVIHGAPAAAYECSDTWNPSSLEIDVGHELLVWTQGGVTCEVSFHGHSLVNLELDLAIARATTLVRPG
jgi:hypothetical protein